jgi:hypothetical protein
MEGGGMDKIEEKEEEEGDTTEEKEGMSAPHDTRLP